MKNQTYYEISFIRSNSKVWVTVTLFKSLVSFHIKREEFFLLIQVVHSFESGMRICYTSAVLVILIHPIVLSIFISHPLCRDFPLLNEAISWLLQIHILPEVWYPSFCKLLWIISTLTSSFSISQYIAQKDIPHLHILYQQRSNNSKSNSLRFYQGIFIFGFFYQCSFYLAMLVYNFLQWTSYPFPTFTD